MTGEQSNMLGEEMNKRMGEILKTPFNQTCADCPSKRPLWVSFLVSPIEEDKQVGVLICQECAQYHLFELGKKRTMIKYLKMAHEWTEHDVENLEDTGNGFCNTFYEAKLSDDSFQKDLVLSDAEEEEVRRSKFVKNKYKKLKYFDEVIYHQEVLALLERRHEENVDAKGQEVFTLLQSRYKERIVEDRNREGRKRSSRRSSPERRSSDKRSYSRSRSRGGGHDSFSSGHDSFSSGHDSFRSRDSRDGTRSRKGRRPRRESSSERRSSYEKKSSSESKQEPSKEEQKSPRTDFDRSSSMKLKDLRNNCRDRLPPKQEDRRAMLKKASSLRLSWSNKSGKLGDELSCSSAHDGNNSTGNMTWDGNRSDKIKPSAKVIEKDFMSSLGIVKKPAISPVVHVADTMDPFLSENEDGPRRKVYAIPYMCASGSSDNEGVAVPLRRRLSDRRLGSDTDGAAAPPTRLQRRLSDNKLMARQAEGGDGQQSVRRRLSNRRLMTNIPPSDDVAAGDQPQPQMRRRLSNRKLSTNEAAESGQQQPRLRRKLSNRNLTGSNDSPEGQPRRMRRNLSNKNLLSSAPAPMEGGGQPQVRRRLSNRNLEANDEPAEELGAGGQAPLRRKLSNRNLIGNAPSQESVRSAGEQPQIRRRLSHRKLTTDETSNQQGGGTPAGGVRRRLSNRALMAPGGNESRLGRNLLASSDSEGITSDAGEPIQERLRRRPSNQNLMAKESVSDSGGMTSDAGEPIQERLRRRLSNQNLMAKESVGQSGAAPAEQGVRRRLSNRNLRANASPMEDANDGKAPPAQPELSKRHSIKDLLERNADAPELRRHTSQDAVYGYEWPSKAPLAQPELGKQHSIKDLLESGADAPELRRHTTQDAVSAYQLASASDADESEAEPNQRTQRRLSNKGLKVASEHGGQKQKRITRKRSNPKLLGKCTNGPPTTAVDESDAKSGGQKPKKLTRKRSDPDLLGKCANRAPIDAVCADESDAESMQPPANGGQKPKKMTRKRSDPNLLGKCANGPPLEGPPLQKRLSYTKNLMEMVSASDSDSESDEERKAFMAGFDDAPTSPSTCPSSRMEEPSASSLSLLAPADDETTWAVPCS